MRKKYARLSTVSVLMLCGSTAVALPFSTFDPRSMAMGSTGVAVNDPALAPFFNPAMLSASDPSKRASIEFFSLGASLIDPGNLHTNWTNVNNAATSLTDTAALLTTNANTLSTNATTLTSNITTLSTNITNLGNITITDAATAATALSSMQTVSTNLTNVTTSMTTVSGNVTTVGNNVNTVSSNISTINQALQSMSNQPLQGELGATTVIGIPNKNWGIAVYANTWAAMGGTLVYNDAGTVSTITTATSTAGTNLVGIGTATGSAATTLATANTSLTTAVANCAASVLTTPAAILACANSLTQANTDLATAKTTVATTSSTVTTNSNNITTAANSVNTNKTMQSQVHIRGVAVTEYGLALSHGVVTNDVEWAWGITPKVMQLRLYDATIAATSSTSNLTGNDYLAYYSTLNFDAGLAKVYLNGWRGGFVVKNVIPQSFDFKNAPTAGATPVANGYAFKLSPQVRAGFGYEAAGWFSVALDADLTRNDPVGLEDPSQFLALGGELSTSGWVQIRAGYRADMVNAARNIASIGFGLSPRLPFFKPHFDFALTASPDIFNNSIDTATQVGAAMKFGLNF